MLNLHKNKITPKFLQEFENEIAEIYRQGNIRAPIHLRGSDNNAYENCIIEAFKNFRHGDYCFGYWDSHALALLAGVPREAVKASIIEGNSIALCFPDYNVFCSGIVGSMLGVAVGTAYGLKLRKSHSLVYVYCGDMQAHTGIFAESYQYALNNNLPILFIVGNNKVSVMTNTEETWNSKCSLLDYLMSLGPKSNYSSEMNMRENLIQLFSNRAKLYYFEYKNIWPHSGLTERIRF